MKLSVKRKTGLYYDDIVCQLLQFSNGRHVSFEITQEENGGRKENESVVAG